jgi:hypothetical protein
MHLLGTRPAQGPRALVDGRPRRVDVIDERQGPGCLPCLEGAPHVAAARGGVEPALRANAARAAHERDHGHAPPVRQLRRELGRWVGPAQQQAVAHGGHDGERLDGRPRQLVRHDGGGQAPG